MSLLQKKSACDVNLCNVNVATNTKLQLKGDKMGNVGVGRTISVFANAEMMCGTTSVCGDGIFRLEDSATLGIGSAKGINSTGTDGNIITAIRNFNSGANYCYYLNENPQSMGKFNTTPQENTVRSIVLNKEKTSQLLTVTMPLTITEQVKINRGEIDQSKYKLLLPRLSEK